MNSDYIKRAEELGVAYANGMLTSLSVPANQGKNFSWEKFPKMCGGIARVSLYTSFSNDEWLSLSDKDKKDLEELCRKSAVQKAQELTKEIKNETELS